MVSIDRSIMRRMKNGYDLVTYRESYLVPVPRGGSRGEGL